MTIALAIAVLVLAVALVYLLVAREPEPVEQPDLSPAIQEAASQATARALTEALPGLLQANKEAREVDVKTAEAALDKRQAEIKGLAERIALGQRKIEEQVQRRGETDLRTQALLEQMGQTIGNLNSETAGLKKALRQPQTRGQWGELQLRRCVEIAGMTEHVDFELQQTLRTEDGRLRPDALFHLPEGRSFVADSKVPLDAFLDAQESEVESERRVHLERHARQAREHVRALSSKDYQGQFNPGEMPDLVICFIPNEPALHAAFAADPELFDYALRQKVLLVSPTSLIGLLRTMELGWRQEKMVERATEIAEAAETLHTRFGKFIKDFDAVGARLTSANKAYNSAVGSMEARLLPQLRKTEEMGIGRGGEIESPQPVEATVREITAPELRDADPELPEAEAA
ncbi:MAG TPA: DNA recombination protein RmuC [Solirubrobacterales bacterium]|nr:DNA recombination protein RmuC [Solirubrobacterales bacterium]